MENENESLQEVITSLRSVATGGAAKLLALPEESLLERVRLAGELSRLSTALLAQGTGEIAEQSSRVHSTTGLSYRYGHAKPANFLEYLTRISAREAARLVLLGTATRPTVSITGELLPPTYPAIASALEAGQIDEDAAVWIIRRLDEARARHGSDDDLAAAEEQLVAEAARMSADLILEQAIAWREALDPDGAEPREEAMIQRRQFRLLKCRDDGMTPFTGLLPPEDAALVKATLAGGGSPRREPMFLSEEDRAAGTTTCDDENGLPVTTLVDPRPRKQRDYDIFRGTFLAGVRTGETGIVTSQGRPKLRAVPTIIVTTTLDEFLTGQGIGWIDDTQEPITAAAVQRMACDAGYRKALLGSNGEILHFGLVERDFTPAQRTAFAVRDGGCVWPGCTAPPSWCEAHHVLEVAKDEGPTDIDNGTLLCAAHHHMLHNSLFEMRMHDGRPELLAPEWIDPDQTWQRLGRSRVNMSRPTALRRR